MKASIQSMAAAPARIGIALRTKPVLVEVLVERVASMTSAGAERAVKVLAQADLLARLVPLLELGHHAVSKPGTEGVAVTTHRLAGRLSQDPTLGGWEPAR